jgi:hypothetical protein
MLRWEFLRSNRHIRLFPLFLLSEFRERMYVSVPAAHTESCFPRLSCRVAAGKATDGSEAERPHCQHATAGMRGRSAVLSASESGARRVSSQVPSWIHQSTSCDRVHGESPRSPSPFGRVRGVPLYTMTSPRLFASTFQAKQSAPSRT